ncbi:MAG: methionine--tRNA ligase subunit beta [Candidatus Altiarchaeales archaeon]|nr:MAG: methionine--tRNA ligase subunit beta [Candidatus Altiarchaeales archaeon]RLI95291.1 MAG: methionine--tRNA ligase subunit beta [Candidatus Altiarchaeales archaeon]RLI95523.1 MAG: methionine--tRNA ligase subunit beta [Candidatus Altiarchaeales archaeon]HDO82463.1 methionine--tRNA ligase subunit beta [Candidatus Altiarchaeales archaeon]HEX55112.1 methionine--tRNA ligase subunit beta [Candidatus Altiarchaeales archaeon]
MHISFDEFKRVEIRIGRIVSAERIKGSEKLIRLNVDVGNENRELVAGIGDVYKPEELIGRQIPVVTNLKPKRIWGILSKGMILAVDVNGKAILLHPDRDVPEGSVVR